MVSHTYSNHAPSWGIVQRSGLRALNPPIQVRILVSQPRRRSLRPGSLKIRWDSDATTPASASSRGATTTPLRYSVLAQRQCTGLLRQGIQVRILGTEPLRFVTSQSQASVRGCLTGSGHCLASSRMGVRLSTAPPRSCVPRSHLLARGIHLPASSCWRRMKARSTRRAAKNVKHAMEMETENECARAHDSVPIRERAARSSAGRIGRIGHAATKTHFQFPFPFPYYTFSSRRTRPLGSLPLGFGRLRRAETLPVGRSPGVIAHNASDR